VSQISINQAAPPSRVDGQHGPANFLVPPAQGGTVLIDLRQVKEKPPEGGSSNFQT
jgi:hypothetical protein